MSRRDLMRKARALRIIRERKAAAPLKYYVPHPKQADFHQTFKDFIRLGMFFGGNRSGKTYAHAAEVLAHLYGYRIWDVPDLTLTEDGDYPPRSEIPSEHWTRRADKVPTAVPANVLSVTGLPAADGIGQVLWPAVEAMLPLAIKNHAAFSVRRVQGTPAIVTLPNGSTWRTASGHKESMALEGANYTAIGFDEPCPRAHFNAAWRGAIDQVAPVWMTMTPLGKSAPWIHEEFVAEPRTDVNIVTVSQRDNPHLSEEAIDAFEATVSMSEEERDARRHGKFGFLSHIAFPMFDPHVHVLESSELPKHWPRILACDPAHRRPFFMVWLAWDPRSETYHVYDEYPSGQNYMQIRSSSLSIGDYATLIRNKEGTRPSDLRVIDPRFGKAEWTIKGQSTTSVVQDFLDYGLHFLTDIEGTARIETGISRIRKLLSYNTNLPIDPRNHPHLVVHKNCQNVITALRTWSFVPPDQKDDQLLKEATMEAWKDPVDCIRYAVLSHVPRPSSQLPRGYIDRDELRKANNPRLFRRR